MLSRMGCMISEQNSREGKWNRVGAASYDTRLIPGIESKPVSVNDSSESKSVAD